MSSRILRPGEIWCECGWPRYAIERCRNDVCSYGGRAGTNFTRGRWFAQKERCGDYTIWATEPFTHLVGTSTDDGDIETDPKANAHLIAAAPDGYEFAEAHEAYMLDLGYTGPDDPSLDETCAEIWRKQRAFLAKARGEQVSA